LVRVASPLNSGGSLHCSHAMWTVEHPTKKKKKKKGKGRRLTCGCSRCCWWLWRWQNAAAGGGGGGRTEAAEGSPSFFFSVSVQFLLCLCWRWSCYQQRLKTVLVAATRKVAVDDDGDDGSSCFFPCFFFSLSLSLFSFSCSSRFLSFLSLLSLFSSFLLYIYRKKQRERGLLPLSSHGIGVGWQGRLLCNRPRGTSPLSPPVVGHESQLRQMGVFVGVFLMFSEKEGEEKSRGENSSSSSASRVQGKKKTHSAVQNGTVWGFSLSLSLSLSLFWNSGWNNVVLPNIRRFI